MHAPPYSPPQLESGSEDPKVEPWQQELRNRGWHIEVDGKYGPESERLCRNFQREHGLTVDGIVGPVTWKQTFEARSTQPQPVPPQLPLIKAPQVYSEHVRTWQQQVNNRGWPELVVDGYFGDQTEIICVQMQQFKGMPITGKIDLRTWEEAWLERVLVTV